VRGGRAGRYREEGEGREAHDRRRYGTAAAAAAVTLARFAEVGWTSCRSRALERYRVAGQDV
jgi:hypothetical protein